MGQKSSKKAKEEDAREDSSTDLEEEEDDKNSGVRDENTPAVKVKSPKEEQDGKDENWWDQPVAKEKKRSRRTRRRKRSGKANIRSRSSSKEEGGDNIWDAEEVIDVEEDEDLVTGIREKQRWAWTENGQGRTEGGEEEEPEAGGHEVLAEDGSQSKEHDEATQENDQASDEQLKNRAASEEQFKGQIVANLSSKHEDEPGTNVPDLPQDPANRPRKEQSDDQAHIYNWPQASEQGSPEENELLEKTRQQQWEMDAQDRRDRRKSYRKRIKFWTEENILRRG